MAPFSPGEYDLLEDAIAHGRRLSVFRRGTEYLVIPQRLYLSGSREAVEAVHPTTGERMVFLVDDIERFEVVR
jgi:hypothetical protein